jgi:molybdopterin synthase sulfur carrier subunit
VERVKLKVLIKFLGPISRDDLEVEVNSSDELKEIIKQNVDSEWLEKIAVAVNDEIVSSLDNIKNGDVISLLPPVCGG